MTLYVSVKAKGSVLNAKKKPALPKIGCSAAEVEAILAELEERQLVCCCRGGYIALATRAAE